MRAAILRRLRRLRGLVRLVELVRKARFVIVETGMVM
jgi:hypothetical protein